MSTALKKEKVAINAKAGAEQAPMQSLAVILDALPDAVTAFGRDYKISYANHAALMLYLQKGSDIRAAFEKDATALHALTGLFGQGKTLTLHDVPFGDDLARNVHFAPLAGTGVFMMTVHMHSSHIMTEWTQKARNALKPAQLMARTLAHEIKNPLTGIQAAAQLLAKTVEKDDAELVTLIARESERILRLVQKVNFFEEFSAENAVAVNIHEVLAQVIGVTRAAFRDVEIVEEFDPSLPDIQGDFDHLVQALLNLLKNAAEAPSGRIRVRTYYDTAAVYHPERHHRLPLCVDIEDNGPGMHAATLARIFEPYFTTKTSGEGLGLAVVSKIIDDLGGTIDVRSEPGLTIFKLSFPMVKK